MRMIYLVRNYHLRYFGWPSSTTWQETIFTFGIYSGRFNRKQLGWSLPEKESYASLKLKREFIGFSLLMMVLICTQIILMSSLVLIWWPLFRIFHISRFYKSPSGRHSSFLWIHESIYQRGWKCMGRYPLSLVTIEYCSPNRAYYIVTIFLLFRLWLAFTGLVPTPPIRTFSIINCSLHVSDGSSNGSFNQYFIS